MKNVEETEEEMMVYQHLFKYRCFLCDSVIDADPYWKHYKNYGNCCIKCSGKINHKVNPKHYAAPQAE